MPGDARRTASPQVTPSGASSERRGPRTRSMTMKEAAHETPPPEQGDGGATGSEVNNEGGGSPSSNESPSSHQRKKKPRHTVCCEIEEEKTQSIAASPDAPNRAPETEAPREQHVHYVSQYLCLSLWRAVQNCEVWDYSLIRAFRQGPSVFAARVQRAVRRATGTGRPVRPEDVTQSFMKRFQPTGLLNTVARTWKKTHRACSIQTRSLKRKHHEPQETRSDTMLYTGEGPEKEFKHRYLMDPPRLIVLSGPEKKTGDEEDDMVE